MSISRYEALSVSIRMIEALGPIFWRADEESIKLLEIRETLQGIAKDVRYGGKWEGDTDNIAPALDKCTSHDCVTCPYMRDPKGCTTRLKEDAASAIRYLQKQNQELMQIIDGYKKENQQLTEEVKDMGGYRRPPELEAKLPAEWQREIMAGKSEFKNDGDVG